MSSVSLSSYKDTIFFLNYKGKMQLFAKYYAISIYVMQIVTPSENPLRNKANFCANSSQRLKTFGFSWQHYIKKTRILLKTKA